MHDIDFILPQWVDLMCTVLNKYDKAILYFPKNPYCDMKGFSCSIDIKIKIIKKYTRHIKVEISFHKHKIEDYLYFPLWRNINENIQTTSEIIDKLINDYLKKNDLIWMIKEISKYSSKNINYDILTDDEKEQIKKYINILNRENKLKRIVK